jgi:hypothetical protein
LGSYDFINVKHLLFVSLAGTVNRSGVVDPETFFQQYEAMKEDYDALRKRYADLIASHSGTVHKLELSQV